jgi:hypothetical protein
MSAGRPPQVPLPQAVKELRVHREQVHAHNRVQLIQEVPELREQLFAVPTLHLLQALQPEELQHLLIQEPVHARKALKMSAHRAHPVKG